jgi:CheY-like chemotaxis protein/two-component sensor histidine kinase
MRASELTGQMLAYSGKGTFVVEALDVSRLSQEMASLLNVSVTKKAELLLDLDERLPAIEGDATQIRQVVMNLLTNASDALEDGPGTIRVRTGQLTVDRGYLSQTYLDEDLPAGDYVFLEVSDTGCGMDSATVARIFDPFFSTKFTGRGLGLATVLGIIRSHRGAIRVYSEPGRGTRVKVLFPASSRAAEPPAAPPAATAWRGSGTVLVVDDEPTVREVAAAILEDAGFDVLQAADGADGLRVFEAHADRIRVVLLDLTMPQLSGEQVCAAIAELRPDARVVLSSGYSEQDATRRIDGGSLAGFIQKPYGPRELVAMMRQALGE